ncbi:hypothetical protein SXIM_49960 [Streptomyces xiamenensis]|uniref:Uncharacterized protein n=1 Tax=Streptomyces xiamenensis TaxID=408015 RepID=A0A0F7FZT2_9ACTN|nr:hypothetical protein SXIM_49960 [Streptomyces xiamenensis]
MSSSWRTAGPHRSLRRTAAPAPARRERRQSFRARPVRRLVTAAHTGDV